MARGKSQAVWIGLALLLCGVAIAVFVACPTNAQAYALVVLVALGASFMLYGFLGQFQLSGKLRGISSGGAGTLLLLLLFFFSPGAMESLGCSDFVLVVQVCEDCPGSPVSEASVYFVGNSTMEQTTDEFGETRLLYGSSRVGELVEIYAQKEGRRTSYLREKLRAISTARVSLPFPPPGGETAQVPTVTYGDNPAAPSTIDAVVKSLDTAEQPDEAALATAGVAAYNSGDYEGSVKLLEAARRFLPEEQWLPDAPYLAAAYSRLGREDASLRTIGEIEDAAKAPLSLTSGRFLALSSRRLTNDLNAPLAARLAAISQQSDKK